MNLSLKQERSGRMSFEAQALCHCAYSWNLELKHNISLIITCANKHKMNDYSDKLKMQV
jgi:hypothetical protein